MLFVFLGWTGRGTILNTIYIYYPNPARGSTPPARGSTRAPARARRHPIHRETVPVAGAPESALRRPFARGAVWPGCPGNLPRGPFAPGAVRPRGRSPGGALRPVGRLRCPAGRLRSPGRPFARPEGRSLGGPLGRPRDGIYSSVAADRKDNPAARRSCNKGRREGRIAPLSEEREPEDKEKRASESPQES
jgi:hypothetical protein